MVETNSSLLMLSLARSVEMLSSKSRLKGSFSPSYTLGGVGGVSASSIATNESSSIVYITSAEEKADETFCSEGTVLELVVVSVSTSQSESEML